MLGTAKSEKAREERAKGGEEIWGGARLEGFLTELCDERLGKSRVTCQGRRSPATYLVHELPVDVTSCIFACLDLDLQESNSMSKRLTAGLKHWCAVPAELKEVITKWY